METNNRTHVEVFSFAGITDDVTLGPVLFVLFLKVYLVSLVGNLGMVALVLKTPKLHTPMYFFLSHLSVVDLLYSTIITPKMLTDLISMKKTISFTGCTLQFFFFAAMAATEAFLLSSMSYDRYAAICHPLHYITIMTKKKCWVSGRHLLRDWLLAVIGTDRLCI
ncbi:unnamed protein product [Ranitomeya imitator]|uniref:G-protein coupled receptors family 1 profile domain-containing protein n=1 Tax=Ranitomeya imitator TaxID=111125 RepID=A0ABN9KTW2_9NEOB|nr:unnamed protein product [Ranitomeya imitator]